MYILHIIHIILIIPEENKLLYYYSLIHHAWKISPHYLENAQIFHLFNFFHAYRVPICDTDELRKYLVATRAEFQHSVVYDAVDQWRKRLEACIRTHGGHLNICCNVACLIFHLPYITTGSFQNHQCLPTTGPFQSHQGLEECNIPSVRWKSCAFYKVVWWHFSGVVGKG